MIDGYTTKEMKPTEMKEPKPSEMAKPERMEDGMIFEKNGMLAITQLMVTQMIKLS